MEETAELFQVDDHMTVSCMRDGSRWYQIAASAEMGIFNCSERGCNACAHIPTSNEELKRGTILGEHTHPIGQNQENLRTSESQPLVSEGVSRLLEHYRNMRTTQTRRVDRPVEQIDEPAEDGNRPVHAEQILPEEQEDLIMFNVGEQHQSQHQQNQSYTVQHRGPGRLRRLSQIQPDPPENESDLIHFDVAERNQPRQNHLDHRHERPRQPEQIAHFVEEDRHPDSEMIQFDAGEQRHHQPQQALTSSLRSSPEEPRENNSEQIGHITIYLHHHMTHHHRQYRLEFEKNRERITLKRALTDFVNLQNLRSEQSPLIVWLKRAGVDVDADYDAELVDGDGFDMFTAAVPENTNYVRFPSLQDSGPPVFPRRHMLTPHDQDDRRLQVAPPVDNHIEHPVAVLLEQAHALHVEPTSQEQQDEDQPEVEEEPGSISRAVQERPHSLRAREEGERFMNNFKAGIRERFGPNMFRSPTSLDVFYLKTRELDEMLEELARMKEYIANCEREYKQLLNHHRTPFMLQRH
ncbi:hypothetical protein QR680_004388 [Steinernema hermaphroditum]|uniref:Uncharacterized protein n=1 Tax=Steinernema hermaphroditum TaxID=289476 RepID=A0AA39HPZ0_9BILA|nr:hypothetical protein QR680_004388 [Steinernema hermaphroditum]